MPSLALFNHGVAMNRKLQTLIFALALILSACGGNNAAVPTLIPDPCAGPALGESIKPINDLQREFDDAAALAANLPREQLSDTITNLQRIRRAAEDTTPPSCLSTLKTHQLAHMNAVIETLLAFVGGADKDALNAGIAQAQASHDQYALELARLIGVTNPPTASP